MLRRFISGHSGTQFISAKYSADIQKALDFMHSMHPGQRVTVTQLAAISTLSLESFRKKFQSEVGEAPLQYLLHYMITKAKEQH